MPSLRIAYADFARCVLFTVNQLRPVRSVSKSRSLLRGGHMCVRKLSGGLSSGSLGLVRLLVVTAVVALLPSLAHAQSSIAGTIRDASGAILPGVTVEAASPVLIEKVRTTVSDGTGQYRLADLLPGTYT